MDFGHTFPIMSIPVGGIAALEVRSDSVSLLIE